MPDDDEDEYGDKKSKEISEAQKLQNAKIHEERLKILAHFQALTGQEQTEQRYSYWNSFGMS